MAPETTDKSATAPPGQATTPLPDLQQVADSLAAKHSAAPATDPKSKVGRSGRPPFAEEVQRYCAANGVRLVPLESGPDSGPAPGPGYVVSPDFVRQMAELALKGVEAYRQRACFLKALAVGADKNLARELGEGNGAPPGAIQVISYSLAEISQKYDWLSQWTPEVALIVALATWTAKDLHTLKRLEELRVQLEKAKAAEPPPTAN